MLADAVSPSSSFSSTSQTLSTLPNTPKSGGEGNTSHNASDGKIPNVQQQQDSNNIGSCSNNVQQQKFVLAPTPAQLGRAPLQRRKNLCKKLVTALPEN